jgi:hypothetical protein
MKIMVLNDGVTFSSICGCQIVEIDDALNDEDIEDCLKTLNHKYVDCVNATIIGGFNEDGHFIVGDSSSEDSIENIQPE